MLNTRFEDLKDIEYQAAWDYQESLLQKVLRTREAGEAMENHLLFCEHPHVYTLGKSGASSNLLINDEFLKKINATYYQTNRGGDITYHGPGQIVGYPILDLQLANLGIKGYIHGIEEAIILSLKEFNIHGERLEGATGVWLDTTVPGKTRKICAIGVRTSHWITMHGFAFNVNTDLRYFSYINPCGFTDKGVTSLEKELGAKQDFEQVKLIVKKNLAGVLNLAIHT